MTLNIYFQTCGLILLILIMVLFFKKRFLRTPSFIRYRSLLISVLVSICLDIASIFALNMENYETRPYTEAICKLYLISIVVVAYLSLMYTVCQLNVYKKLISRTVMITRCVLFVYILLATFLRVDYFVDNGQVYTYGPYVVLTYAMGFSFIFTCTLFIVFSWKSLESKVKSVIFMLCAIFCATLIQMFNNELLLVSFAMSISMVFIYLYLENPNDYFDKISGIFNVEAASVFLENELKKRTDINFISVEITGIKFINETFGSESGNKLLVNIAKFLKDIPDTFAFRMNGAIFTVAHFGEESDFDDVVDNIRKRFNEHFRIMDIDTVLSVRYCIFKKINIPMSIGERLELIRYFVNDKEVKEINGTIVIDEVAVNERLYKQKIEKALNEALEFDRIMVYYQPIFNNKKGLFTSAEALMRIKDEDGKFIPPDIFIPVAEKNGLIIKMGLRLFEKVCQLISENDLQNTSLEYIEVNLSVIQCMQRDLADSLLEVMDRYNVNPSFINFEITETAASNSENTLLQNMKKLLEKNSTFSLDDYGSGYSNINYVLDLPICLLKYDKNMVWSYFDSEKGRVILDYTVNMTKELNLRSLAEGVETEEQFEHIKKLGIEYTQGYYFSKPLPPEEFIKKIK